MDIARVELLEAGKVVQLGIQHVWLVLRRVIALRKTKRCVAL